MKILIEQEPVTNEHSQSNQTEDEFTPWHDYFGGLFKESLIPLDLDVESNYAIGKGPPRVDLLIIRKENTNWTESQLKYLPNGVRQSKRRHIIMELKKTQSISIWSVWKARQKVLLRYVRFTIWMISGILFSLGILGK